MECTACITPASPLAALVVGLMTFTGRWGFSGSYLLLDTLLTDASGEFMLEQLAQARLEYRLTGPTFGGVISTIYESSASTMSSSRLCRPIKVLEDEWQLCVWVEGWSPSYTVPLLVVVAVVAHLLSGAALAVLLSRHEHRALLHSLLPAKAIQRLQANLRWATDSGDCMVESGTPAEMMLGIVEDMLLGNEPPLPKIMAVRSTLQQSLDVYKPLEADLTQRMADTENMDSEVREALMVQLMGRQTKVEPKHKSETQQQGCVVLEVSGEEPGPAMETLRHQSFDTYSKPPLPMGQSGAASKLLVHHGSAQLTQHASTPSSMHPPHVGMGPVRVEQGSPGQIMEAWQSFVYLFSLASMHYTTLCHWRDLRQS
ncbi:hypothetical protein QJQ45_000735 [Haematococcus lacustris]|nr:hypothetical protein QJQ45_000735 [Haematococcus lacustris]